MKKFPETQKQPRLHHEEVENVNRTVTSKETELVIKNLLQVPLQTTTAQSLGATAWHTHGAGSSATRQTPILLPVLDAK